MDSPAANIRPSPPSRSSSKRSNNSLTLDLSNLPPLQQPTPPSNTLLFTNLQSTDIFRPDNLVTIKELVANVAPIHSWAPLKSFRRIVVSFYSEDDAIKVRGVWDGEAIMGERCRVYFGQNTPVETNKDYHLALPDAGKLFFISPPPSPPHDWEMRLEGAPNKEVHADDLAEALARLHHASRPQQGLGAEHSPVSPVERSPGGFGAGLGSSRTRSRSSTLIFSPEDHSSSKGLPCIAVDDMTDEFEEEEEDAGVSPMDVDRPIMAHTSRPPVELMGDA